MFEVYKDRSGLWRWRLVAKNGKIIADSGQGYSSKSNAVKAIGTVKAATRSTRIKDV